MTLSIVIVNYNVKYFLEQCLESVFGSRLTLKESDHKHLQLEVFVVDNASVDGSVEMVRQKFPQVQLIANRDNVGFAKANNQALRLAKGDIMLLLNPDTVVEHDTLARCVDFYSTHPDCGGLAVKMVNGEGVFLKESKRGFPSPAASFFKMSGLVRLFPHSRRIAAYYMGHLSDDETNPVDILPGAFLMISREAMEKVGLLDESYFMYGEDIDFSWRIKLAGFENYYFPQTRIIHYKGECTKHGSMNYVYTFYNAMAIFVNRYFSGGNARLFNLLLRVAIWARASLAWIKRVGQAVALPMVDFAVAFSGFLAIKHLWATCWAANVNYYPAQYTWMVIPCYILLMMACSWLYGGYEKPVKPLRIIKGMAMGCASLLVFYSLLNESQRYSRVLLLLGCGWTLISSLGIRGLLGLMHVPGYGFQSRKRQHCLVVGTPEETARVRQLYEMLGSTHVEATLDANLDSQRLNEAIHCYKADEVIFCSKDLPIQQIIDHMTQLTQLPTRRRQVEFKIAPSESDFIIGSNSIHSTEDLYTEELHTVVSPLNRRNKRLLDVLTSFFLVILSPLLFWPQHRKRSYFQHCWQVMCGKRTWVGTDGIETKPGIFSPEQALTCSVEQISPEVREKLHLRYLRNYKLVNDLQILIKNIWNI
ncbi:MAG: glycosyltransferase family 2 protein [Bacteroidales bacterium]|nr:glycosyltransferase family 2 protein [Bacteroidales bacterium]